MSEFTRELKRQLTGDADKANPLATLGISAHVLDLGLTEDELYDYIVKDVARRLILRFHPDRSAANLRRDIVLLQKKYQNAYDELRDRKIFDQALAEFRNMNSEERRETKIMRRSLVETRGVLDSYRSRERYLNEGTRQLNHDMEMYRKEKEESSKFLSDLKTENETLYKRVKALRKWGAKQGELQAGLLRYTSYHAELGTELGIYFPEANWAVVAALVPPSSLDVPLPISEGVLNKEFEEALSSLEIPESDRDEIIERWEERFGHRAVRFADDAATGFFPRLHVLKLSRGKIDVVYGGERLRSKTRVIGSVPETSFQFERKQLTHLLSREVMFHNLVPFLSVGSLLVSVSPKRVHKNLVTGRETPFIRRETRSIILGVG